MTKESVRLDAEIVLLTKEIEKYPPGDFSVHKNGKYVKWVIKYNDKLEYLKKNEWKLAKLLAKKKHLNIRLNMAIRERRAIEYYLRHHDKDAIRKEQEFLNSDLYKPLSPSTYVPLKKQLENWMKEPYEQNSSYPEKLIHDTIGGHKVRSKSEALIVSYLVHHLIPYRYECKLYINDVYVYPDFTIRHPITGEIYYWEHFGRLDDPKYLEKFITKMKLYISAGILPGKNLIITTETRKIPLTYTEVEKMIKQYFEV